MKKGYVMEGNTIECQLCFLFTIIIVSNIYYFTFIHFVTF